MNFTTAQVAAMFAVADKQVFHVYEKEEKKAAVAAFVAAPCDMHNQHVIDALHLLMAEHKPSERGHDTGRREVQQVFFKKVLQEESMQTIKTL